MPNTPDYQYITQQGIIVADTEIIKAQVEAEYIAAFGSDLDLDPSTPQGLLIAAEVLARSGLVRANADLANQINPNLAGGGFLDAICALTGLQRSPAAPSVVSGVSLTGIPGAIIPAGSRASTGAGDLFESVTAVQLDNSGNGSVAFQSVENGAIPCLAGALTTIVDNVLGWETVTNPNGAVLGRATQSDQSLRVLRRNTLALQGVAIPEAITSAVSAVEGVNSLQFRENITNANAIIDGVLVNAHGIWVCVDGGTDDDIGLAILSSKSVGADMTGATTVQVVEPSSGQEYTVRFDRPTPVTMWFRVTIKVNTPIDDPVTSVTDAILNWAGNNIPDVTGLTVGNDVSPFEVAAAIVQQVNGIYVKKVEVSDDGSSWQTTEWPIAINQIGTADDSRISVIVE